ncbi:MAG: hypothetical protein M3O46_04630, partial [Myxococcota bacterium]|nr:hypothetical protein [Myxococcota bacterium]
MTASPDQSVAQDIEHTTTLETAARKIAETDRVLKRGGGRIRLWDTTPIPGILGRVRRDLSTKADDATLKKAAEWFFDNYYLIRRVARQVVQDLPPGFLRRLPLVAAGPAEGLTRIDSLARGLVALDVELDGSVLRRFVDAYQEVSPLTIAELWALPTMLRVAVLHVLLRHVGELGVPTGDAVDRYLVPSEVADRHSALTPTAGIARSIGSLRFLGEIDWKAFFENTNKVEAILRKDPALIYAQMDFETCDSYRKGVEELAWSTASTEERVANLAVSLARDDVLAGQRRDVGYYLVGDGRRALEHRLGYRPTGIARIRRFIHRWPSLVHLGSLTVLTLIPLGIEAWALKHGAFSLPTTIIALLLTVVPSSVLGTTIVQWVLARLLPPRTLPKLDFSKGVPEDARTLVVIPTLLARTEDVESMVRQIELH